MKDGADVGERFTRASARGDDEVFARRAQTDGFELMAVEGVALEDFGDRVVEQAALRDVFDAAGQFVGWVELEEWIGPELTFGERRIDFLTDGGIGNVDEAPDVAGVIGNDLCVGVEDVHSQNLGSGRDSNGSTAATTRRLRLVASMPDRGC